MFSRGATFRLSVLLMGAVGGALLLFLFNPAEQSIFPPCPFHWLTGWHCPGCGSLRATHQLLHGQFGQAWRLNPLMILSFPVLALAAIPGSPVQRVFSRPAIPWIWVFILLAYWILRNIPLEPFTLLAPH